MRTMRMILKSFCLAACMLACSFSFLGCSGGGLAYYDQSGAKDYNRALFYKNPSGVNDAADPFVLLDGGDYYLYATSGIYGNSAVAVWKSADLAEWALLGPAFTPDPDAWAVSGIWAPEVYGIDGRYYMYYTGEYAATGRHGISIAVSDTPQGPFRELSAAGVNPRYTALIDTNPGVGSIIDGHVFEWDGERYFYYTVEYTAAGGAGGGRASMVWGVKLRDDLFTFDSEPVLLLAPELEWEVNDGVSINEAPAMLAHDGRFYLTYSGNGYTSRYYAVGYAVSDAPLGKFEKPAENRLLYSDNDWEEISGSGHHCFVSSKDGRETRIVYHVHDDPANTAGKRRIAADRIGFRADGAMYSDGPSGYLRPLDAAVSGYRNIAAEARVQASGGASDVRLLTDGEIRFHEVYGGDAQVWRSGGGKTKITLQFPEKYTVRVIMLYASADPELTLEQCAVEFAGAGSINALAFYEGQVKSAVAEFNEIRTSKIVITVDKDLPFALSEIIILGR